MSVVLERVIEQDVKTLIEDQVEKLGSAIDESSDYVIKSLYKIYSLMLDNGQYNDHINKNPGISRVKRVVKCNGYIPNCILDLNEVERVVIGGLYVLTDIYVFPTELISKTMRRNRGSIINPELEGLLPESVVNYGTTKRIEHFSIALPKDSWLCDWVNYSSQYDYVSLTI